MDFHYDPILGLVYNFINPMIMIDLDLLPKNYGSIEEVLHLFKQRGVELVNSEEMKPCTEILPNIFTNAYLCN